MKKFLLFVLLTVVTVVRGQSIQSVNNYSETSVNFQAELGSGNFVYNVPLFNLETVNPDFTFSGNMWYNAQAASTVFTSDPPVYRGWSLDFIPTIYRNILEENTLWDEKYYLANTDDTDYFLPGYTRPERANDRFEFNIFGIKGAFRLIYNTNSIEANVTQCNIPVEVVPTYTISSNGSGKNINLISFTVIDKDGFRYEFNKTDEGAISQQLNQSYTSLLTPEFNMNGGLFVGKLPYKKSFLITAVYDKYNRLLMDFSYSSTPVNFNYQSYPLTYNQMRLEKIEVTNKAKLLFDIQNSYIKTIRINDANNLKFRKITLGMGGTAIYNAADELIEVYGFSYYFSPATNQYNNYGNPLKTNNLSTICLDADARNNNQVQDYTRGVLKSITTPHGGKINIEYETNTYHYYNMGVGDGVPQDNDHLHNQVNYRYVEVPLTANSFYYESGNEYYVKFDSQYYENPDLNPPVGFYPGVKILNSNGTLYQGFEFLKLCEYGTKINPFGLSRNVTFTPQPNYQAYISNIRVYKKELKPANQLVKHLFGPSIRVKKISQLDGLNNVLNELNYSYQDISDPSMSSGIVSDFLWDLYARSNIYSVKPFPIFYKYITVQEENKGKTVYELNVEKFHNNILGVPRTAFLPKNIWKYNGSGQLVETVANSFEYFSASEAPGVRDQVKKTTSVIVSFEGTQTKTVTSERLVDAATLMPANSKITDTQLNETFEEQNTYQKLGNAFYRTAVQKSKNSTALNQSTFSYQQLGTSQAYNLKTVSVAKEAQPLEVEKEITLTDDYGNVLEYKTKDGMVVSQIWGYNDSKMVAELKNVPYAGIAAATIATIKSKSAATSYDDGSLLTALNSLRTAHSTGYVTTYTYKPLVGINTMTDANGRKETYQYDSFNRLYRVLNHEGLVIKEYDYHLKN